MQIVLSLLFIIIYFLISLISIMVLFFLTANRVCAIYDALDMKEQDSRIKSIRPHIRKGEAILDIGAGSGRFGKAIQDQLDISDIVGVEVCDYSDDTIPIVNYDGVNLPFQDKFFDTTIIAFVLHHIVDQKSVFEEACRVTRKRIIIFEDTYNNIWEKLFVCWNDYHTNIFQGWIKARKGFLKGDPSKMPMPLTFHSVTEWLDFFNQFSVESISYYIRNMGYKPLKKVVFIVELEK